MKLIRKTRLYFREGNSDKVYEVDLCDLGERSGAARYMVNFRYGRRGMALKEGTKTVSPVTLDEANAIFDSVVVSKTNKGYQAEATTTPVASPAGEAAKNAETPTAQNQRARKSSCSACPPRGKKPSAPGESSAVSGAPASWGCAMPPRS